MHTYFQNLLCVSNTEVLHYFQIGKGVRQGYILSPCLFNLHADYIMRNAGLEEAQAAIKIAGRNINNLRHADDTTLMAESEEELKSLLMKVREENEKASSQKLWYIYTMEYYSAIKKNAFESVLMRWMKLEPII